MSSSAWIPVEREKWYAGWEKERGVMYYVHSSSNGVPRYNSVINPQPPMPDHRTIVWTRHITRATSYPNKASITTFANKFLRKGTEYVLFGYEGDMLKHMEQVVIK